MKKAIVLALVLVLALVVVPAFAETVTTSGERHYAHTVTVHDATVIPQVQEIHNVVGAKIDAPNLVGLTKNLSLGFEGGKDIIQNAFYPDADNLLDGDTGYFAYAKVTYTGCWLNCK